MRPSVTVSEVVWPSLSVSLASMRNVLVDAFTVTATSWTVRLDEYLESEPESAWLTVDAPVATPLTVNVWGLLQLLAVKESDAGSTVALVVTLEVGVSVTPAVGSEVKTAV